MRVWKSYSMPSPQGVGKSFIDLAGKGTLWEAIRNSLIRGAVGYVISLVLGIILGILLNSINYFQK